MAIVEASARTGGPPPPFLRVLFRARPRRRHDRFLEWKIAVFSVAAAIAVAGIYLEERWMTGLAIVLLLGGMVLRFLPGGAGGRRPVEEDDDGEDEDGIPP